MNKENIDETPQPFFVRFLEQQELDVDTDVKAGKPQYDMTMKWPSDGDEGGYPSW